MNSSVSILKITVEDFKKYFLTKINEVNKFGNKREFFYNNYINSKLNQAKAKVKILTDELNSNNKKIQVICIPFGLP